MDLVRRLSFFAALLAAAILLCLAGSRAVGSSGLAGGPTARLTVARQFYARVVGHWVGSTISRLDGAEPVMGYFHLLITRVDENTFREAYTFYRIHPTTGGLERSGTQSDLSTIASNGTVRRTSQGSGTVLINLKAKNQAFAASGETHFTGPDHLKVEVNGKIAVDGMPLKLGKNGKLKATGTWSLEGEKLISRTHVETKFRVLFFSKRYRIESQLRAQRGANVQIVAGRAPTP